MKFPSIAVVLLLVCITVAMFILLVWIGFSPGVSGDEDEMIMRYRELKRFEPCVSPEDDHTY